MSFFSEYQRYCSNPYKKNIYFFIREENTEIVRLLGTSEQDFQISTNYSLLFKLENGLAILSG
jgi:hypothetical protein